MLRTVCTTLPFSSTSSTTLLAAVPLPPPPASESCPSISPNFAFCTDSLSWKKSVDSVWIARAFPAYEPNRVLISNGLAAMGFALPAAVAAKLVHPELRVVAVSGDGGFLMNVQELETAKRLGLAVVNVIFRDGGYNLIQWKQQTRLGRESGVAFTNPDFVTLAQAFGARGFRVNSARDLRPVLEEALRCDGPSIVDVPVDYTENPKLTERLGHLVCPI